MEDERQLATKFETVSFKRFFVFHLKRNQSVNMMLQLKACRSRTATNKCVEVFLFVKMICVLFIVDQQC